MRSALAALLPPCALAATLGLLGCADAPRTTVTVGLLLACDASSCDGETRTDSTHWLDVAAYAERALAQGLAESRVLPSTDLRFVAAEPSVSPEDAANEARRLVLEEGAVALVVASSQDDLAIHRARLGVPLLCVFCGSPDINDPGAIADDPEEQAALRNEDELNFALGLSAEEQALVLLRVAEEGPPESQGDVNGDGILKIVHLAADEPAGRAVGDALESAALTLTPSECIFVERVHHPSAASDAHDFAADAACALDAKGTCPPYEAEDDGEPNGHGRTTIVLGGDCGDSVDVPPDVIVESAPSTSAAALTLAFARAAEGIPGAPRLYHFTSFRSPTTLASIDAMPVDDRAAFVGAEGASFVTMERDGDGAPSPSELFDAAFSPVSYHDAMVHDGVIMTALATLRAAVDAGGAAPTPQAVKSALRGIDEPAGARILPVGQGYARALGLFASGQAVDYDGLSGPCDFDKHWRVRQRMTHFRVDADASTGGLEFTDLEIYNCVASAGCPASP